jgi:hypothetical protein
MEFSSGMMGDLLPSWIIFAWTTVHCRSVVHDIRQSDSKEFPGAPRVATAPRLNLVYSTLRGARQPHEQPAQSQAPQQFAFAAVSFGVFF